MPKQNFYLLLLLLVASQSITSQHKTIKEANTIVETIPFILTDHNNMSVAAVINEVDTVSLMFHLAANSIALIEQSTAKMNSIKWTDEHDVKSWGGASKARYSESNLLEIGTLQWEGLAIWEDINSGPTTDGKFGPNLFEDQIIEIDFDRSLITIHTTLPYKANNYEKNKIEYDGNSMFIAGESIIDGIRYSNKFLIHSGYGGTILYDDKFAKDSQIGQKLEIIDESELKDSYGNILKTKKAKLPVFKIGSIQLRDIPVGFFEGAIGRQSMSVLGGDLLKRFNLIIDAKRENIYLKENKSFNIGLGKNNE